MGILEFYKLMLIADLREAYQGLNYSHASIMFNALNEIPQLTKLVQIGVRDYCHAEWDYIKNSNYKVITYFEKEIKSRQFEGETWKVSDPK